MLPKDRSHIDTEQRNTFSSQLHLKSIEECLDIIAHEDRKVLEAVASAKPAIAAFLHEALASYQKGGRVFYVGAGTSGRLGVLDASEVPPTYQIAKDRFIAMIAGGDSALRTSAESKEDVYNGSQEILERYQITKNDILVGIAAGGTTPYVIGAFEIAKKRDPAILTCFMTCACVDRLSTVDHHIYLPTGAEVVTGSTRMKAGTATKMVLNMISTTLMIQTGRVLDNLMVDLKATNEKLVDRAIRILTDLTKLNREESYDLLMRAQLQVKTALVMHFCSVDFEGAEKLLDSHDRNLSFLGDISL